MKAKLVLLADSLRRFCKRKEMPTKYFRYEMSELTELCTLNQYLIDIILCELSVFPTANNSTAQNVRKLVWLIGVIGLIRNFMQIGSFSAQICGFLILCENFCKLEHKLIK